VVPGPGKPTISREQICDIDFRSVIPNIDIPGLFRYVKLLIRIFQSHDRRFDLHPDGLQAGVSFALSRKNFSPTFSRVRFDMKWACIRNRSPGRRRADARNSAGQMLIPSIMEKGAPPENWSRYVRTTNFAMKKKKHDHDTGQGETVHAFQPEFLIIKPFVGYGLFDPPSEEGDQNQAGDNRAQCQAENPSHHWLVVLPRGVQILFTRRSWFG